MTRATSTTVQYRPRVGNDVELQTPSHNTLLGPEETG